MYVDPKLYRGAYALFDNKAEARAFLVKAKERDQERTEKKAAQK